jgi:hypothetical protein
VLRLKAINPVQNPNPEGPLYDPFTVDVVFEGIVRGFAACRIAMKLEQQSSDAELLAFAEEQLRAVVDDLHAYFHKEHQQPAPEGA